jgi:hypothetical protein
MNRGTSRKRRHGRLTFKEPITDLMTASHDVSILDLSLGGVRVEHIVVLRPGSTCHLRLPLKTVNMIVICDVVWSRAVGISSGGPRGSGLLYHSGLMFTTLSAEARLYLTAYLDVHGTPSVDQAGDE